VLIAAMLVTRAGDRVKAALASLDRVAHAHVCPASGPRRQPNRTKLDPLCRAWVALKFSHNESGAEDYKAVIRRGVHLTKL
jgi:hypothetical protein